MNDFAPPDTYGVLTEPATLTVQRRLPGPVERIWAYLTESELRRKWLAAGEMEPKVGAPLELVWRNDELTDPPGERPAGFGDEHRMQSRIIAFDPPHRLVIAWGTSGEVSFDLAEQGDTVLLTLVHRRLPDRKTMLLVATGWHMHLNVLVARSLGNQPEPFWQGWSQLREEYDRRLPADAAAGFGPLGTGGAAPAADVAD